MTYEEFIDYCLKKNPDIIFVRAKVNNKWQSVSLASLTEEHAMEFVNMWWEENRMPVKLLES